MRPSGKDERRRLKTGLTVFKQVYSAAKRRVTSVVNEAKIAWYRSKISNSGLDKLRPFLAIFSEHELPSKFMNFFYIKNFKYT